MPVKKTSTIVATIAIVVNNELVSYSIIIRQFPDSEHEWSLPEGTRPVSYHPSKNTLGIAKHAVGADRSLVGSTDVPLDYDGDRMPTIFDVEDYEWDELFTECGSIWPEFHKEHGAYVQRIHLISELLKAAGVR